MGIFTVDFATTHSNLHDCYIKGGIGSHIDSLFSDHMVVVLNSCFKSKILKEPILETQEERQLCSGPSNWFPVIWLVECVSKSVAPSSLFVEWNILTAKFTPVACNFSILMINSHIVLLITRPRYKFSRSIRICPINHSLLCVNYYYLKLPGWNSVRFVKCILTMSFWAWGSSSMTRLDWIPTRTLRGMILHIRTLSKVLIINDESN